MEPNRRDEAILDYLAEIELALPPKVLYYNMKEDREITFSERTLKRRLKLLMEAGLVDRVDGTDGYYRLSTAGRGHLDGDRNGE